MCDALQVSRSGYYDYLKRQERPIDVDREQLSKKVVDIFQSSYQSYGSRRISQSLKQAGFSVGRYKARSLMREAGIRVNRKKPFVKTTDSDHRLPVAENILNREFSPTAPNRVWGGDITYLWTKEGWLYLAIVLDFYSRRVVGWALQSHMKSELVEEALQMAYFRRKPCHGLIHHSDRGSQYASSGYRKQLEVFNMEPSMSRKGNCWDNSPTERFFGTLKGELYNSLFPHSRSDAKREVIKYIEMFYNSNRLHSTLGYQTPMSYEKAAFGHSSK